ncbi:MAG: SDR family NAD(P)-dependent oxidoreductase [Bacteroidota bacterium]
MNILITGGHSGIGLELTKKILEKGHQVGLIVKSEARKSDAEHLFPGENKPEIFIGDLSDRGQIKAVAEELMAANGKLDGLFNNAGVLLDKLYLSKYGNELQLEVNAISPYLLTKELKPLLDKADKPFVINTATAGLNKQNSIDIPTFKKPKKFTKLFGSYLNSKLMLVLLMNHLSTQWQNVRIVNVDPGAIKTKMTAGDGMPFWLKPIRNLLFKAPEEGAQNLYDAGFKDNYLDRSGIYLSKGKIQKMQLEIDENQIDELLF